MNMIDVVLLVLIAAGSCLAVRHIRKSKGGCCGSCDDCAGCRNASDCASRKE